MTDRLHGPAKEDSPPFRRLEDGSTMHMSRMTDDDTQRDEVAAELIPVPLCDDEDEPVTSAAEPAQLGSSDGEVEGHGSWGVGDSA